MVTMAFVLASFFVAQPELNIPSECRKAELAVATYLKKAGLKAAVIHRFCALGVLSAYSGVSALEIDVVTSSEGPSDVLSVGGRSTLADAEVAWLVSGNATPQVGVGKRRE